MSKILVLGATGMVGRRLTYEFVSKMSEVRCAVRNVQLARKKLPAACEICQGDIADLESMQAAMRDVSAVYNCVHTISRQSAAKPTQDFVDVELQGIKNILTACQTEGVRRLIYITFLGVAPDAKTSWGRGRWRAEQMLLKSGLDVTVLRPGQIVGKGGHGFDAMMAQAKRSITIVLGSGQQKMQNIALDDLVYYLVQVLDEPQTFGQVFDVGCDSVLTSDEMIDAAASILGRTKPRKIHFPSKLLIPVAAVLERAARFPKGAFRDLLAGMEMDLVGDPRPIRAVFPHPLLNYRQAVERALQS